MKWDEMTARERDALVATEVMGWRRSDDAIEIGNAMVRGEPLWTMTEYGQLIVARRSNPGPWHPTEDIACAWEVVEKMEADGWRFVLQSGVQHPEYKYRADFHDDARPFVSDGHHVAGGMSAPDAICRCALRAKGVEV